MASEKKLMSKNIKLPMNGTSKNKALIRLFPNFLY